ncbi:heat shock factor protein 5 [Indicator indicator]|uniref:heat shock factor protein 5 n=1 Tax=Indicator indicator TaxID=1002788 RepID=UPI0023E02AD0|nr:heat shock factor protein 5 [Indicator indicator]
MEEEEQQQPLPVSINPETFPAKLWRLVNSPRFRSVHWDARGQGLLIDEQLFVSEVLDAGPSGDAAAGDGSLFKTKSFTSFIRQLNLYGFQKVSKGLVMAPGPVCRAGGDGGGRATSFLHHFHSPHFCRNRPDLLVHLKRLTSTNKMKLAAGLELPGRPASHLQQLPSKMLRRDPLLLLLPSSSVPAKANSHGLLTTGESPQPYLDTFFAYPYVASSPQHHSTSPTKSFNQPPVPSMSWQNSLELLPRHGAPPTFPHKGLAFPTLRNSPTEVTYSLHTVCSLLPIHQWAQNISTALAKYSSSSPSLQYSQAYYPTGAAGKGLLNLSRSQPEEGRSQPQARRHWVLRNSGPLRDTGPLCGGEPRAVPPGSRSPLVFPVPCRCSPLSPGPGSRWPPGRAAGRRAAAGRGREEEDTASHSLPAPRAEPSFCSQFLIFLAEKLFRGSCRGCPAAAGRIRLPGKGPAGCRASLPARC